MKIFFTFLMLLLFVGNLVAQQPVQYSLYMLNKYAFNPAYAGLDHSLNLTAVFRKQWLGLKGSPSSQHVNVHMPAYFIGGGIGIKIENDILGAERNTSVLVSYNYQNSVSNLGIISIGLDGGILQKTLDGNKLRAPEGIYQGDSQLEVFDHQDQSLPNGLTNRISPTFNIGLYFQGEQLEVGLSTINILEPKLSLEYSDSETLSNSTTQIKLVRSYFFNFSYKFHVNNDFVIYPSLFIKSDIKQTQMEISALVEYNDNIFLGASFRGYNKNSVDAIVMFLGLKLNEKTTLAYSYDLTLSKLNSVSKGTHEVLLTYNLNKTIGKGMPPKIIYNPRSL